MKRTRLYWQSILVVGFAAVGTLLAAQTGDALKIPGNFKQWYLVHSTLITKYQSPMEMAGGLTHPVRMQVSRGMNLLSIPRDPERTTDPVPV